MMQDKFLFSDEQTITTDETSTSTQNLEAGNVADQQVGPAWLCMTIVTASGLSLTNGFSVSLMSSDSSTFTLAPGATIGTEDVVASMDNIPVAEIVAGASFCVGFLLGQSVVKKYLAVWYSDEGDAVTGTLKVDTWIQNQPLSKLKIQKAPVASSA